MPSSLANGYLRVRLPQRKAKKQGILAENDHDERKNNDFLLKVNVFQEKRKKMLKYCSKYKI